MTFWLHRFRKLDVRQKSHRKMLIDTFINAIFLYDDKMVMTSTTGKGQKLSLLTTSKPHCPIRKLVRIWIAQLHQAPKTLRFRGFPFVWSTFAHDLDRVPVLCSSNPLVFRKPRWRNGLGCLVAFLNIDVC